MTDTATVPVTEYATEGESPNRVIAKFENGENVLMMTEIAPGSFVAWESCNACGQRVAQCACAGGPTAKAYIERWRQENLTGRRAPSAGEPPEYQPDEEPTVPIGDEPTEHAETVDAGLDAAAQAVEAARAERDLSEIEVDF